MTSACRISNLHVAFGKTEILHGVSLEAPARGVTMLTGRSGSGKTTLLRALNRLNETFPGCRTTGSVEIDLGRGMEDIYGGGRPVSELRRLVGMVFQTPNVLPVSVYRNIAIPLEAVRGMPRKKRSGARASGKRSGTGWTRTPPIFRGASSSASAWPGLLLWSRQSFFWTSPLRLWTWRPRRGSKNS